MEALTVNDIELFCKKFLRSEGCWIWTASTDTKGYGKVGKNIAGKTKMFSAHRLSYFFFKGHLTKGLTIDHLCGNPLCVNPSHLEEVTQKENNHRSAKLQAHWAEQPKWASTNGDRHGDEGDHEPKWSYLKQGRICSICRSRSRKASNNWKAK